MRKYIIQFSKMFTKEIRRLSVQDQELVLEKVRIIEEGDPYYKSLRTKKLKSNRDLFESRVNKDIRLIWYFKGERIIVMLEVGRHDILDDY